MKAIANEHYFFVALFVVKENVINAVEQQLMWRSCN